MHELAHGFESDDEEAADGIALKKANGCKQKTKQAERYELRGAAFKPAPRHQPSKGPWYSNNSGNQTYCRRQCRSRKAWCWWFCEVRRHGDDVDGDAVGGGGRGRGGGGGGGGEKTKNHATCLRERAQSSPRCYVHHSYNRRDTPVAKSQFWLHCVMVLTVLASHAYKMSSRFLHGGRVPASYLALGSPLLL